MKYKLCKLACVICLLIMLIPNIPAFAAENTSAGILEIKEYEIPEGALIPGRDITLRMTLKNSGRGKVNNADVTISVDNGALYPSYGEDNQIVVEEITSGSEQIIEFPLRVNKDFKSDNAVVRCYVSYVTNNRTINNELLLVIPSNASSSLVVSSINVAEAAIVGGKSLIGLTYSNRSGNDISDAKLLVTGNVEDGEIELPNVAAGKTYQKDLSVVFTEEGQQQVEVVLQYTDNEGREYMVEEGTFVVNVSENAQSVVEERTVSSLVKWLKRGLYAVFGIAAVVCVVFYARKYY